MPSWEEFYSKAKEHKSLILNFIDSCPDMFWTKDIDGKYTYINKSTSKHLLLTKVEDAINKDSKEIAIELRERGLEYTIADNCISTDKFTIIRGKPTLFYEHGRVGDDMLALRVMKAPIYNKNLNIIGIIGVGKDITHHIKAYDKIEKLFNDGNYEEAKSVFLAYKQKFESMRDVKDPDSLLRGLR